ncbi:MAG: CvpA family protein [Peptococcaceae bacterium]
MLDLVLAVIFLVVAITGFRKGFLKSLIGLFGNFLALAGSYVLAAPVTQWLNQQFGIAELLAGPIGRLLPMPESFSTVMASFIGLGQLYSYLDQSILPASLRENIIMAVQEQINAVGVGVYATMADIIATTVAMSILKGLVFIVLWALLCVALFLVSHVLAGVVHLVPVVGLVDRLGGMLVSLLLAAITLLILYKGISVLGLMEGSLFAESQVLHFCSQFLNADVAA